MRHTRGPCAGLYQKDSLGYSIKLYVFDCGVNYYLKNLVTFVIIRYLKTR